MNEVLKALKPVVRRIRRNRLARGAAAGLAIGAVLALAVQAGSFFVWIEGKAWIMAGCVCLCALAGAGNALRPVSPREAAKAADGCGLKERVTTALEVSGKGPMDALLQRDACDRLKELDPGRIVSDGVKKPLLTALACTLLAAGLFVLPNVPEKAASELDALRARMMEGAEKVAEAAGKEEDGLNEEEKSELRRLTADLKKELGECRERTDAMVTLDRAAQRLEQMRNKLGGDAMQRLADALAAAELDALAEALRTGDG